MDELRILNDAKLPAALDTRPRVEYVQTTLAASMRRMMAFAAFVSLGGGFVVGTAVVPPAVAASPITPLIPASPLAPSTLLDSR